MLEEVLRAHKSKIACVEEGGEEEEPPAYSRNQSTAVTEATSPMIDVGETLADLNIEDDDARPPATIPQKDTEDTDRGVGEGGDIVVRPPTEEGSGSALFNRSSVVGDELSDDFALEGGTDVEGEEQ